jgi:hypothetical protein
MAVDPHAIPVKDAAVLTARWRKNMPAGGIHGARFDRIALDNLLAQPGCAGIRVYLGMKTDSEAGKNSCWTYVLVGIDANGNDMCGPYTAAAKAKRLALGLTANDDDGGTEEDPLPCPPSCGDPSPLNGGDPPP